MPTEGPLSARRVAGVDFSGARDAGDRIWIAEGTAGPQGVTIESCVRARDLPGGAPRAESAMPALVDHVARLREAVVGFDFPFSLPATLIPETRWTDFVAGFARRYPTPDDLRAACMTAAGGRELKRRTDVAARVPFSAYNIRLYRQTWHGIAAVLRPLIAADRARVLPIQRPAAGKPALAETCPASLLKAEGLYLSYKGRAAARRDARRAILAALVQRRALRPLPRQIRVTLLEDAGGDALDAVIAAIGAARASRDRTATHCADALERIEARIFF